MESTVSVEHLRPSGPTGNVDIGNCNWPSNNRDLGNNAIDIAQSPSGASGESNICCIACQQSIMSKLIFVQY